VTREGEAYETKARRCHSGFVEPWDIDVASQSGAGKRRLVGSKQVVPEPAAPHEGVGVKIDGAMAFEESAGIAEGGI
jgi:hypothetical protein